ncbi:MAG TPA: rhodanese-like domain-containing protein [Sedimenticola sp.]|nr:rhodanese-like domain-containing protein [Sedimenticola sp.]
MQQYLEFAANHLFLVSALVVVLALLAYNLLAGGDKASITPFQATELINHDDAVVVDVRPIADFSSGHIINAINIPANGLKKQLKRLEKYKQRPLIMVCRSGAQSATACRELRKEGFEKVYNLRGGILAWQSANLPVSRKK